MVGSARAPADPRLAPIPPASAEAVRTFGNVTLLERPVQVAHTAQCGPHRPAFTRAAVPDPRALGDRARAEESLRIADQRKDEFLATLGHELRNPLRRW